MSKGICTEGDCGRTIYARGICAMHYQRFRLNGTLPMSPMRSFNDEQRFWYYARPADGCWIWSGPLTNYGYGSLRLTSKKSVGAHRFAYELFVGPITDECLDHLCRNRACVRPSHLEAVTLVENTMRGEGVAALNARKTHCKNGHPLAGENLQMYKGGRMCRTCKNANARAFRARRAA